jgi:transcription elongation factor GreA
MPEEKKIIMSPEKIKALQEELDDIKMNRRKQNAQRLKEAKAQGDISENAECDNAMLEYH